MTEGQTVYIYISTGPDVEKAPMPNVVGMELDRVKELMDQLGFTNVRYEQVESQKPVNEVVYQSVAKNTDTDVSSEIIIHYSGGLQEEDETQPTEPEETVEEITITVSWEVPEKPIEYRLEICLSGTKDILESKLVPPNTASTYVELTGSGSREYDLYIDGVYECTKLVDFN